ncbi:MAG: hypothetical protein NZ578_14460 [Candidatus Binatia bacterium]|nr:hypothetical protein [Candidatus Binatia bacterium]
MKINDFTGVTRGARWRLSLLAPKTPACLPGGVAKIFLAHNVAAVKHLSGSMARHLRGDSLRDAGPDHDGHGGPKKIEPEFIRHPGGLASLPL